MHKSQLTTEYGGTAPIPSVFWPPTLPPMPEAIEHPDFDIIAPEDYVEFWTKHQTLRPMPRELRTEFPPLPIDVPTQL